MTSGRYLPSGLDGSTGRYAARPGDEGLAAFARRYPPDPKTLKWLRPWLRWRKKGPLRSLRSGDARDLGDAGWGVIFAADDPRAPAIRGALDKLLQHRRGAASRVCELRYRELLGEDGYRRGESKFEFLSRFGVGPGPAEPDRLPYYLLLVGDPEAIPYAFQYQLDVQYAVGRIHFATLDEYKSYAENVVSAESDTAERPRRAVVFAPLSPDDPATQISVRELAAPLADWLAARHPGWRIERVLAEEADKERLARLLGGDDTPDLVFTAGHGVLFPPGDRWQLSHQGALVCRDWPGPRQWHERLSPQHFFSADDVGSAAALRGLISFHFACYSAGTPAEDDFCAPAEREPARIAPHAFVARLPQRLLGHPGGGALATVGHVERAWGYSIEWPEAGRQIQVFEETLGGLLDGEPIGFAMERFGQRYAELASALSLELGMSYRGRGPEPHLLASTWAATNDARNYAVVGDPAVRLGKAAARHQSAREGQPHQR